MSRGAARAWPGRRLGRPIPRRWLSAVAAVAAQPPPHLLAQRGQLRLQLRVLRLQLGMLRSELRLKLVRAQPALPPVSSAPPAPLTLFAMRYVSSAFWRGKKL